MSDVEEARQLAFMYDWFLEKLIPCLDAEGYSVFTPPSLERLQESYDLEPWSPFVGITQAIRDRGPRHMWSLISAAHRARRSMICSRSDQRCIGCLGRSLR
jgi:hypothetical protein